MGFFKASKKKPGTINEALNHRERVEREKAAKSPAWAAAKRKLEEISGPEGQHLVERQRLQAKFEADMEASRETGSGKIGTASESRRTRPRSGRPGSDPAGTV